jgi:hypothetical protein
MNENPRWVLPAMLAASAVGGALLFSSLSRPGQAATRPTEEQIEAQRRQQVAQAITQRLQVEQLQPLLIASIPVMGALGAFLLWKARQQEA